MLDQPVAAMTQYGRYLGDRYRSRHNIVWVHGGDTNASGHGAADHVNAIANGIRDRAPNHLHTAHCSRGNSGVECYDEPWLDVNTTYSNCSGHPGATQDDSERTPPLPFFFIEGSYENSSASLGCLVDQFAVSVLGGSTGHVFGNTPLWRFGDGWQDELGSAGSRAMGHLGALFRSRDWFRLEPDFAGDLLLSGGGADALAARTTDGRTLLVNVTASGALSVDLSALSGSQARAWWFDPTDGSASEIGLFASDGVVGFSAPGRRLLVIDDAAANLPAPGQP
jgi:hypothetical protein